MTTPSWLGRVLAGDLLPPSPPAEKATARQNQAGQSGATTGLGTGSGVTNSAPELAVITV
jgi:hypothetical protein